MVSIPCVLSTQQAAEAAAYQNDMTSIRDPNKHSRSRCLSVKRHFFVVQHPRIKFSLSLSFSTNENRKAESENIEVQK